MNTTSENKIVWLIHFATSALYGTRSKWLSTINLTTVLVYLRNCRLYENRYSYISDTKKVPKFPTKCFARLINWFSKRFQYFVLPIIFVNVKSDKKKKKQKKKKERKKERKKKRIENFIIQTTLCIVNNILLWFLRFKDTPLTRRTPSILYLRSIYLL